VSGNERAGPACRPQPVVVPPRFCDGRVKVMQADAREVSPTVLQQYAPQGFDTVLSDMVRGRL
jgi:hypothetical protein